MRLSIKYEQKLDKKLPINELDIGVLATEILRLKKILYDAGVCPEDKNLVKLRLWRD